MRFRTVAELIAQTEQQQVPISDVMLQQEEEQTQRSRAEIWEDMKKHLVTMQGAVAEGLRRTERSRSGLTGGDAQRLWGYRTQGLAGETILGAAARATAVSETNAAMGTVVATPTAGACGILPGVLVTLSERNHCSQESLIRGLFVAGAMGLVIANNASISGAAGGCQAEVGSATAMAAAAAVEIAGGAPAMSAQALAIALKSLLGLVCDPVAGLVEAPCVKRNAIGASIALVAADMAMAGITSVIPADEVIGAMHAIGSAMPESLRETARGGLATTPTGQRLRRQIFGPCASSSCARALPPQESS